MLSIKTLLHPTDFSECSGNALALASALAADYDANLVIVHVVAAPLVLSDGVIFSHVAHAQAEVRDELDQLQIPGAGIDVIRRLEEGNPAAEIVNLAQIYHADLIVMGSHGRGGLQRWLMGSVAESVMRQAACPVMIVTAPPHDSRLASRRNLEPTAHF